MAIDKQQIKELLGSGLGPEVVATAVGCSPTYISQLLSDESFHTEVVALRTASLQANNKRDRSIDGIEDNLLRKLDEMVESGMFYKPQDVLRATQIVNSLKRRGVSSQAATTINNTIVNLNIPAAVNRQFVMNKHKEVIEIEGQSMVTMPAHMLLKTLSDTRKELSSSTPDAGSNKYDQVSRFLPAAIIDANERAIRQPESTGLEQLTDSDEPQVRFPRPPGGSTGVAGPYPRKGLSGKF